MDCLKILKVLKSSISAEFTIPCIIHLCCCLLHGKCIQLDDQFIKCTIVEFMIQVELSRARRGSSPPRGGIFSCLRIKGGGNKIQRKWRREWNNLVACIIYLLRWYFHSSYLPLFYEERFIKKIQLMRNFWVRGSQFGIFWIFLTFRFYLKPILKDL